MYTHFPIQFLAGPQAGVCLSVAAHPDAGHPGPSHPAVDHQPGVRNGPVLRRGRPVDEYHHHGGQGNE